MNDQGGANLRVRSTKDKGQTHRSAPTTVNVSLLQRGIYHFPAFSPAALVCFSSREFDAIENFSPFLEALGMDTNRFCTIEQVHGNRVILAKEPFARLEADGLVTRERGLALVIRTADCAPVFFFDSGARAVGICHAGWRGAQKGIVPRTVETLQKEFGSNSASLRTAIGPAICSKCYEVGKEFEEYFPGEVEHRQGRYFFDLVGAVKKQLMKAGVREDSISDSHFCTACAVDRFFSARREGNETGRLLSVIVLK